MPFGRLCDQDEGLLDRNTTIVADLAPAGATPTLDSQPRRIADFATLGEALDYAAEGRRGMNFHDARGQLTRAYPFSELREDALAHAHRFIGMGLKPGDRVALVAETDPNSRPASSGPSTPACGRFRFRCRPASADAKPMSISLR